MTPWPSSVYEKDDSSTETKVKLDIPKGALPKNFDDIELSPDIYNKQDGFSYAAPMIAAFPTGVDGSNLADNKNIAMSITDASPTVVIDMSTGELVPHFAELDAAAASTPESQALYIRPAKLLKPISITKANVKAVVDDGFVTKAELCTAAYAAACTAAGIS